MTFCLLSLRRLIPIFLAVLASTGNAQTCKRADTASTWKWAASGGVMWLQYGDHKNRKPLFTLERTPSQEAIRMVLHVDLAMFPKGQEVPGYMPFSFEGGFHTRRDSDIRAVDGMGFLHALDGGGNAVIAGSLKYPEANLRGFQQVVVASKNAFRFYAGDLCYEIPLPSEPRRVMTALLASQKSFSAEAPKLFTK